VSAFQALMVFDRETRERAWTLFKQSENCVLHVDEGTRVVCPLGACLYILGGGTLFPYGADQARAELRRMGFDDLAEKIDDADVHDLVMAYEQDWYRPESFGVEEQESVTPASLNKNLHPAMAVFDQETRERAWAIYRQRDAGNNVEVDGEMLYICPMGACIYGLGGRSQDHLFPVVIRDLKAALVDVGRDDLAKVVDRKTFYNFCSSLKRDEITAAVFGVEEGK
jgi:hypothetical protein